MKKVKKDLVLSEKAVPLQSKQKEIFREISSVGSERLPYKQRVGGSNPSSPTKADKAD